MKQILKTRTTPTQKLVALMVMLMIEEGRSELSIADISSYTCLSRRAVQMAVKALSESGFLKVVHTCGRRSSYSVSP